MSESAHFPEASVSFVEEGDSGGLARGNEACLRVLPIPGGRVRPPVNHRLPDVTDEYPDGGKIRTSHPETLDTSTGRRTTYAQPTIRRTSLVIASRNTFTLNYGE